MEGLVEGDMEGPGLLDGALVGQSPQSSGQVERPLSSPIKPHLQLVLCLLTQLHVLNTFGGVSPSTLKKLPNSYSQHHMSHK